MGWGWVGGNYGSILHNSMFWGVFLGLQPSCAAARLCFPVEWFQRILLTTVANTQPERAVQYGMDTIATASLRKRHPDLQYSIGLYCNKVLRYLQYCQRICNLESKKIDRMSITIFKLIQYLCYTHRNLGRNLQYWLCTALLLVRPISLHSHIPDTPSSGSRAAPPQSPHIKSNIPQISPTAAPGCRHQQALPPPAPNHMENI